MKYFIVSFFMFFCLSNFAQTNDSLQIMLSGTVIHGETKLPLSNVHVINTTTVKGTITNGMGVFDMAAKANDTLLFSYVGFESLKVIVTNDWVKNKTTKIVLSEKTYVLEETILNDIKLTGYIVIDTKRIPVKQEAYRYNINGLNAGYEVGEKSPGAITRILGSIFNPADFLYNAFGQRSKQMKKLKEMKKDDTVRTLLASKFDRETLAALLEVNKEDIPLILQNCNYSEYFIKTANDLQIMDAISACYEEYKILNKNK